MRFDQDYIVAARTALGGGINEERLTRADRESTKSKAAVIPVAMKDRVIQCNNKGELNQHAINEETCRRLKGSTLKGSSSKGLTTEHRVRRKDRELYMR